MNIFYLDHDPALAAQYACDKHVVKMILETAMILSTNMRIMGVEWGYQRSYENHPCTKWARQSLDNWRWLGSYGIRLCMEYTYRYNKVHKSAAIIGGACPPVLALEWLPIPRTPVPLCMPSVYKHDDPVKAYRDYYISEKYEMLSYTTRVVPDWLSSLGLGEQK